MKQPSPKVKEVKEPTTVPETTPEKPGVVNVPPAPALPQENTESLVGAGGESLESLTQHVQRDTREPNQEAIKRAREKDEAAGKGKGGSKPGVPRGPYKKKDGSQPGPGSKPQDVTAIQAADEKYRRCWAAGEETIEAMVQTAAQIGGEEWGWRPPQTITLPDGKKITRSEQERGRYVFGHGFAEQGWEGPSPLVTMFVFALSFAASRLNQPETKKKVSTMWEKFKLWRKARQLEKDSKGKPIPVAPPSTTTAAPTQEKK